MSVQPEICAAFAGKLGAFTLDAAFNVPMRGVTALFGPSGCGKTTVLRCMAGLQVMPGRLSIGDETWQDTERRIFRPPHHRHIGYVFQEASLFPHLSVRSNLLYGARRSAKLTPSAPPVGLDDIVDLLGIAHLLDRSPANLSGGERQRVAVGRALLSGPRVLLMDEPLSALDRMTKDDILPYFEVLHETLSLPIIYVSHDLAEVERLADTLVLMENGRVLAIGSLPDLQTDPRLPLLAARDATVVLEGRIAGTDTEYGISRVEIVGGELLVPGRHGDVGEHRRLRIAASDVSLVLSAAGDTTILNCLPARIQSVDIRENEPHANVILRLGADGEGSAIAARITRKSLDRLGLTPGRAVFAQIKSVALIASRGTSPDQSGAKGV
ncbi:MAG: molybdenum ABC transporter ATP-binding protein [Hyphomicrobiaceae bacterium]